jgi:hypothetical protein
MPLTYRDRGNSGTQTDVLSGELRIGTLWKKQKPAGASEDWRWSFNLSAGPPGFEVSGRADTKTLAQHEIERVWLRWVDAAGLQSK